MRTVLKILQWYRPGERWLLKCPQHLENIRPLATVFPDATLVITQRDPVGVVQSAATMRAYGARTMYHRFDADEILDYWTALVERLLRAAARDRRRLPGRAVLDVAFHEYMADTIGTVEAVYAHAGLELTDVARTQVKAYLDAHPRDRHGSMSYDLRTDFGIEPHALRKRYAFHLDEHPVPVEVR